MVEHLYVRPDAQERVSGQPCSRRPRLVARQGYAWVFQRNHGARAFYARRGFTELRLTDGADNEEREARCAVGVAG